MSPHPCYLVIVVMGGNAVIASGHLPDRRHCRNFYECKTETQKCRGDSCDPHDLDPGHRRGLNLSQSQINVQDWPFWSGGAVEKKRIPLRFLTGGDLTRRFFPLLRIAECAP